ncbi:nickel-dependent hydrogenase large subunit [Heliobacillus mobilis]|uniref:Nickel-dependent hydrogenase large subunit n=1 Tax=Heliobacterium mobile TaxID=28064 RepID=A0A6I3SLA0_HELMO|nr:nickel-dependent hydrogenase large subunit [Heliobacterium mobile]MTV49535.1 nickel-dependent hydrogenase large subunit [Heliobacterium mobile]
MSRQRIMFSPVTRLSGLLSVEVFLEGRWVAEANASATLFRGFEWIMRERHVTDAVYLTQRVCGICSTSHGAVASYLLDDLLDNSIPEQGQYLRNIMFGADFLQNHIRHFYLFSLPDFVRMPDHPPFQQQNLADARFDSVTTRQMVAHYFEGIKASQKCHQILALFGGKAPHQHSFVHGGVSVAPTADKVATALALLQEVNDFVQGCMVPDTERIAQTYGDYFHIGETPRRMLSFGLFRFGEKNEQVLWRSGLIKEQQVTVPQIPFIKEEVTHSWYNRSPEVSHTPEVYSVPQSSENNGSSETHEMIPDPYKGQAYSFVKSVQYAGETYQVGPLARMLINGFYRGGTSTMDRIYARTLETVLIVEQMKEWLGRLIPGPPPIQQNREPVKKEVVAVTDAMRGALLHRAQVKGEQVSRYDIITPTVWNFSPKDGRGQRGPVESALVGTEIPRPDMLFTVLGRIVRSFDPCLNCATHVMDIKNGSPFIRESKMVEMFR